MFLYTWPQEYFQFWGKSHSATASSVKWIFILKGDFIFFFGQVSHRNSKPLDNSKQIWEVQRQVSYSFIPCENRRETWVSAPTTSEGSMTFRSLSTSEMKSTCQHWPEKHTTPATTTLISHYLGKKEAALWEGICRFVIKPGSHPSEKRVSVVPCHYFAHISFTKRLSLRFGSFKSISLYQRRILSLHTPPPWNVMSRWHLNCHVASLELMLQ